ncbi:MAG TPA: serine/threonine-protein kinase, partial [Bryobacteraceae bacterium]|nr:serine/threonine-protein kinase [Bryobacteraceae bacterium]
MARCPSCATDNPDSSRFCGNCAAPLDSGGVSADTMTMARPASAPPSRHSKPSSTTSSADEGRFMPGTLLLDRYRIVALLGRGGMGEVYRATDLTLNQPVALKFLPEDVGRDDRALQRLLDEVRIARQVSHPNVCRVYDIGEIDGHRFLSMEYVDGEDLASLLRRIGRVPADKALEIARKVCAGLAAAHDKGVLHRDLKPANVMLDGRGNVLIADFGLAAVSGQIQAHEIRHGTPAYMAPEQLAGKEVTVRSDIYALGLLLYEIFTGKRAFEAASMAELMKLEESGAPLSLTTMVKDIDPAVERVILRCLAPDPRNRPVSAISVAAALPGGDPVAAALAAGETPSPDMVAASGETEGLRPRVAIALLAGVAIGLLAVAWLTGKTTALDKIPFDTPPDALAVKARDLARRLGYTQPAQGVASGYATDGDYSDWLAKSDPARTRWANMGAGQPAFIYFWYRQSPRYFAPRRELSVDEDLPVMDVSGEVEVSVDTAGRLILFRSVPPQKEEAKGPPPPADWNALFAAAGLDPAKFQAAEPQWTPLAAFDTRAAWTGVYPAAPKIPLRVEAASWRGQPVFFKLVSPWTRPGRMEKTATGAAARARELLELVIIVILFVGSGLMARRNTNLRRADVRGAARLAGFLCAANAFTAVLSMYHLPNDGELTQIAYALTEALFQAAIVWLLYLAVEPFVRRRWPRTIVSWTRILSGKLRDPLVGADILIGVAFGLFWIVILELAFVHDQARGGVPNPGGVDQLMGVRFMASGLIGQLTSAIGFAFGTFFLFFLLRM